MLVDRRRGGVRVESWATSEDARRTGSAVRVEDGRLLGRDSDGASVERDGLGVVLLGKEKVAARLQEVGKVGPLLQRESGSVAISQGSLDTQVGFGGASERTEVPMAAISEADGLGRSSKT